MKTIYERRVVKNTKESEIAFKAFISGLYGLGIADKEFYLMVQNKDYTK